MNNDYKKAMSGVHHSDELIEKLLNVQSHEKTKKGISVRKGTLLSVVAVVLALSISLTAFAITSDEPLISFIPSYDVATDEEIMLDSEPTNEGVSQNDSKITRAQQPSTTKPKLIEKRYLFKLDSKTLEDVGKILVIASNKKFTAVVDDSNELYVFNHLKNRLNAKTEIEPANDYKISIDENDEICITSYQDNNVSLANIYDKKLNLISSTLDTYNEVPVENHFEYIDDPELGTIYQFDDFDGYYLTPYHENFQIVGRINRRVVLAEKVDEKLTVRIKNFRTKKQLGRITVVPEFSFNEINQYFLSREMLSFVVENDNAKEIYVWDYSEPKFDIDVRVEHLSYEDLDSEIANALGDLKTDFFDDTIKQNENSDTEE